MIATMPIALDVTRHTAIDRPLLCPELRLHLITPRCDLWRATEDQARALGLSDPYWAFCWAGGQALARYILDHPERFVGRRVLDFGAGGAVEGIAAARAGASVLAADIDPVATSIARDNARLNGVTLETTTDDLIGTHGSWDVVLAGDVCYEEELAGRVFGWLSELAREGVEVLIGDPRRGYLDESALERAAVYDAPADNDPGGRHLTPTPVYRLGASG